MFVDIWCRCSGWVASSGYCLGCWFGSVRSVSASPIWLIKECACWSWSTSGRGPIIALTVSSVGRAINQAGGPAINILLQCALDANSCCPSSPWLIYPLSFLCVMCVCEQAKIFWELNLTWTRGQDLAPERFKSKFHVNEKKRTKTLNCSAILFYILLNISIAFSLF